MTPEKKQVAAFLPNLVGTYIDMIANDPLTAQNISVVTELLARIGVAGKMDELEGMLKRHGNLGLQAPYNEIIHSGNILLEESKSDGRCMTVLRSNVAEAALGVL